jgi:hypothetical protein
MNTATTTSVREDMRAAEARIRKALSSPSAGERIDALSQAYNHLPRGGHDAFVAALIGHVALGRVASSEVSAPSAYAFASSPISR